MSKNNNTKKAVVATVNYAGFEFPGLKLPNGEYAIAIPQVVDIFNQDTAGFQFLKKNAQRDIKTLLGNGFQFLKTASEIHPKKVNTLSLEQFGELVFEVAFKGNEKESFENTYRWIIESLVKANLKNHEIAEQLSIDEFRSNLKNQ